MLGLPVGRALLLLSTFAAASCAEKRDTPAFFESVTGLPLCDTARIDVAERRDDVGRDWEYSSTLRLSDECRGRLFADVRQRTGRDCRGDTECSMDYPEGQRLFISERGDTIQVIATD